MYLSPQDGEHEASAAAAPGARAAPSGPKLRVCDRGRMGGRGGEFDLKTLNIKVFTEKIKPKYCLQ